RQEDGLTVMTRLVLPGELVKIHELRRKKGFSVGRPANIIEASDARITPACPFYGSCGGCDLQHCSYPTQLQLKRDIVRDLLVRSKHPRLRQLAGDLSLPHGAINVFGYRQRIRLHIDQKNRPAFHHFHSHRLISVDNCLLAGHKINSALTEILKNDAGQFLLRRSEEIELMLNPASGKVTALFHLKKKISPTDRNSGRELVQTSPTLERALGRGENFPLTDLDKTTENSEFRMAFSSSALEGNHPLMLSWEAGGFCQVNLEQNDKLIKLVLDGCQATGDESILDLFCGLGNFSIPLALTARSLLGVEGQGSAIRSANHNSTLAGLTNTSFEKCPVDRKCRQLIGTGQTFDHLVIDPPRQGVPGLANELAALTRKRLVYVSCDPATLCRDLARLLETGFILESLQLIDMFPQTHHIESVAVLEKSSL
ncbi:MAG: 23S rRNA (uracil(1939)-C(5))-methyltransferase RlmD, partial [Thermodesulfobacteriota bacterium]